MVVHSLSVLGTVLALLIALVCSGHVLRPSQELWDSFLTSSDNRNQAREDVLMHNETSSWRIQASPGRGRGLFATRPIARHERVLVEAPLFVIEPPNPSSSSDSAERFADMLARVRFGFDGLTPEDQAAFAACHEHRFPGEPARGRLFYIFRSNAYAIDSGRWGMFPRMARLNHACRPNVAVLWDDRRRHHVVWATRAIAPGEELLVSYVRLLHDTPARQRSLRQYGFSCDCAACTAAAADRERVRAGRLLRDLETQVDAAENLQDLYDHLSKADALLQYLHSADEHEQGALAGYLPRVYRLAVELEHLAAARGLSRPSPERAWAAEEAALRRQLLQDGPTFPRSCRGNHSTLSRVSSLSAASAAWQSS